jgi:hypothetical protein
LTIALELSIISTKFNGMHVMVLDILAIFFARFWASKLMKDTIFEVPEVNFPIYRKVLVLNFTCT